MLKVNRLNQCQGKHADMDFGLRRNDPVRIVAQTAYARASPQAA